MKNHNPGVDIYFVDGCGRCPLKATPKCKVNTWKIELALLRTIVLESELKEELKWGVPCYTLDGKNVLSISAFKEHCVISFFKGVLLTDERKLLQSPGQNSQAVKWFRFTNETAIIKDKQAIKTYIAEAVELEKSSKKIVFKKITERKMPQELETILDKNATLDKAFHALSAGRQRGYLIYFSQPKQSQTRIARIEKCVQKILEGKGLMDK